MSGVLNHPPQRIIQQLLVDLGKAVDDPDLIVTDPDSAWHCSTGVMPDTPDNMVTVRDTTGKDEGREHVEGYMFEKHGTQITIRSGDPVDGYTKGARLLQALNGVHNSSVTVTDETGTGSSDYNVQSVMSQQVIRAGQEPGTNRYLWTINSLTSLRLTS